MKEKQKKNKYIDLARELKKLWNMIVTVIPIVISALCTGTEGFGNKRTRGDHRNYSIVETGQNTAKNPRDLKGLANADVKNSQGVK